MTPKKAATRPPHDKMTAYWPGWPDSRGWAGIAIVALTWKVLDMIEKNPQLLANASFMQLCGAIVGAGGLGLFLAFHFASSSGTAKANQRAEAAERRADQKDTPK
jgi:hypothetical protein